MNHGDTILIILSYTIDGEPITQGGVDEMEFTIGSLRFTLDNGIEWDAAEGAYTVALSQRDTFALPNQVPYQLRVKVGETVGSDNFGMLDLGRTLSRVIL